MEEKYGKFHVLVPFSESYWKDWHWYNNKQKIIIVRAVVVHVPTFLLPWYCCCCCCCWPGNKFPIGSGQWNRNPIQFNSMEKDGTVWYIPFYSSILIIQNINHSYSQNASKAIAIAATIVIVLVVRKNIKRGAVVSSMFAWYYHIAQTAMATSVPVMSKSPKMNKRINAVILS